VTSGRKPKPTWLKIVTGNPGHRPLNVDEPQLVGNLAEMAAPAWFSELQRAEWDRVLRDAPYLKNADRDILVAYCVAVSLYAESVQKVAQFGMLVKAPATGTPMNSPYYTALNKQARMIKELGSELGLSPASRSRVSVAKAQPTADPTPFDDLKNLPV
jgi:P27 family predicted phage terminase small subunit